MTTQTWVAGTSGQWDVASNWTSDSVPTTGDTAVIASGVAIVDGLTIQGESNVLGGLASGAAARAAPSSKPAAARTCRRAARPLRCISKEPDKASALAAGKDKASALAAGKKVDESVLLGTRLVPDMLPLSRQVQIACRFAEESTPGWPAATSPRPRKTLKRPWASSVAVSMPSWPTSRVSSPTRSTAARAVRLP